MRTILENCRIIDGAGNEVPSGHVAVEGKRIEKVGRGAARLKTKKDTVVDLKGCTVLPGIIDCHVHLGLHGRACAIDPFAIQTRRKS